MRAELMKIDAGLQRRPTRKTGEVERRVGRWMGHYPAAAKVFEVTVRTDEAGRAMGLAVEERLERLESTRASHGAYLLRTNHAGADPERLWRWYIQLTQAEAAFRIGKSDLHLRPVFHQKTERVEAHILVCFLALALWRSLEQWTRAKGLGDCARQLLLELDELRSMDVVLPTAEEGEVRLRVVGRPEKPLAQLLAHLGLELPRGPRILENVVQKNGRLKTQPLGNQPSDFPD